MKNKNTNGFDSAEVDLVRNNITLQRKKQGLTQVELAQKMGVTQRVISYYENEASTITLDAIAKIAKALKVPKRKLLDTNEDQIETPLVSKALQKRIDKIKDLSPRAQKNISDMIDALATAENI